MKSQVRPTKKPLRTLSEPFVVEAPRGQKITTRAHFSDAEEQVIVEVGGLLTSLANKDLAERVALGAGHKHLGGSARKQALTARTSSRWAGTITRGSDDQYNLAMRGLRAARVTKIRAIDAIEERLVIPTGTSVKRGSCAERGRKTVKGYPNQQVRWLKQQRRNQLIAELIQIEAQITSSQPSIVRGGRKLLNNRHHLIEAGLSVEQWRERWDSSRMLISADGEASKLWGNETIRVNGDTGVLTIRLPNALAHLSNTEGKVPTYVFTTPVKFSYHEEEWAAQVRTGAVGYSITFDPLKKRWYLHASWTTPVVPTPSLESLRSGLTLGVDLNADHLAAWVISPEGVPLGRAIRIELDQSGATTLRDGHLRAATTELLHVAKKYHCTSITVENLNFADARDAGRESLGMGKKAKNFRRVVSGIPSAKFRDRLSGMAANAGISVIAVDPAYTSAWGREHWLATLSAQSKNIDPKSTVTGHACAAVVIGRRGKQYKARNKSSSSPRCDQRITTSQTTEEPGLTAKPAVKDTFATTKDHVLSYKTQKSEVARGKGVRAEKTVCSARSDMSYIVTI
jgi:IS605 OrfB family transposase